MRTVAIIQARMGSTRLPGKVLAEVAGKPLLQHMIERVARAKSLRWIVVAMPVSPASKPMVEVVKETGAASCFMGSETDVLKRVLGAARYAKADVIVELTGDCPLIDPAIIDEAVHVFAVSQEAARKTAAQNSYVRALDFVSTSRPSLNPRNVSHAYPPGMDVRVFTTETLAEVDRLATSPADREHVSSYIWRHQLRYWCHDLLAPEDLRDEVRLTVDTPEDLLLVREIFETLLRVDPEFDLKRILDLVRRVPQLREINRYVVQKGVL